MDNEHPQPLTRTAVRVHAALSRCMRKGFQLEPLDRLGSQFSDISRLVRRFRVCQQRGWTAAQQRERNALYLCLDDLEDSIRHLTNQLGRDPIEPPTLRAVLDDLREISDEFGGVRYESGGACLVAVTEPIVLEDIALGQFELRISLNALARGEPLDALHAVALAPNPCSADDGITHPHVNKERICLGDATTAFQSALQSGRLADAFLIARAVLTTYNSDSPYCKLDAWYGRPCSDCGHIADGDDLYWCEGCEKDFCDECFSSCAACGTSSCDGCLTGCRLCDERVCDDCLSQCSTCGTTLCNGCLDDGLCPSCLEAKDNTETETDETSHHDAGAENQSHEDQAELVNAALAAASA